MSIKRYAKPLLLVLLLAGTGTVAADEKLYLPDSLIIPMDTTYQDFGMLEAYGLVYDLLSADVPVDWVIAEGKAYGGVDFRASAEDLQSMLPVTDHGYRGGPLVVDSAHFALALPIVQAWQAAHPAVNVHRATVSFVANAARELTIAPNIAIFVDGKEEIAFGYLNAAAIPMSNGDPWPARRDHSGEYTCPGEDCCPDCLSEEEAAGPTTTSHTDGALFDGNGTPRYCQFLSMHYRHPAPTPEVVAEVREFLQHRVHFLAECQAVNAFENAPDGGFLTLGGLVAGTGSDDVDRYHHDDPFAQADGTYSNPGGSEPAFTLEVGSAYHDNNAVMVSRQGTAAGVDDIWMNGFVDADPGKGKVSYLGGHKYTTNLPISANPTTQGTRYFLNSLFEAPCSTAEGQPDPSTRIEGAGGTNDARYTVSVCYDNAGDGVAFDAELTLDLPAGASFVSATGGGAPLGDTVVWNLGSIAAGAGDCAEVTVDFGAEGSYGFTSTLAFSSGLNRLSVDSGPPAVVRFGSINLLRFAVPQLDPQVPGNGEIFVRHPADPGLDPALDVEVVAFEPALAFPNDVSDLLPGSPPLVFYELDGSSTDTLRVDESGGKIVVSY